MYMPSEAAGQQNRVPSPFEQISAKVRDILDGSRGSHAWDHTQRVCRLCERIGPPEGADMTVLRIAALLHDIGRASQDAANGAVCHAEIGADMAVSIIEGLSLAPKQMENILHCIRAHRYRNRHRPESVEARVLFDADKLDAIGAIGVARAYLFAGEVGARLHNPDHNIENTKPYSIDDTGFREFKVKLIRIKGRILTETGRQIAEDRHRFMVAFFERFIAEYEGNC